jgi:hypothetical protein
VVNKLRILIIGSNTWPATDIDKIDNVLREYVQKTTRAGDEITFVYADDDKGVATFVPKIVMDLPINRIVSQEVYETDWEQYDKTAPHHRNKEMVSAGADICLAFFHGNSRYVYNCVSKAESAGICVRRFNYNSL